MPVGRKGMGSHKHGISGSNSHSPRFKHTREREENERLQDEQKNRQHRKEIGVTHTTVSDAIKNNNPKRKAP
jgi:hypothetical protein